MKSIHPYRIALWMTCALIVSAASIHADQLQMQNGDRYTGKVLSVTEDSVVVQSDVLGKVTLPRNKITSLTFGETKITNTAPSTPVAAAAPTITPNTATTNVDLVAAFRNLGANTNFVQQIRQQMLAGSPEGGQKYDELVSSLMSGQMDLAGLRKQAQSSIDQINELKQGLGPEAADSLDSYLTILQSFVNETAPAATQVKPIAVPPTNSVRAVPSVPAVPAEPAAPSGQQTLRDPKIGM